MERGHRSSSDIMEDYCDGEAFKSHPLFSVQASAIQILLYFDELEVCNPIGTKAKTHKLGTVCFSCTCEDTLILQEPSTLQLVTYLQNTDPVYHQFTWLHWSRQHILDIMVWIQY